MIVEITNDDECIQALTELEGDIDDVKDSIGEVDYAEALSDVGDMQEKINAIHVYLTSQDPDFPDTKPNHMKAKRPTPESEH